MVQIIWEFHVREGKEQEFEFLYNGEGLWVGLFRDDPNYHGTTLLRDRDNAGRRYLTIDRWTDYETYLAFKEKNRKFYDAVDARCRDLTDKEELLGVFLDR